MGDVVCAAVRRCGLRRRELRPGVEGVQYGIQDDAWLESGPGTLEQRLATFKRLGVPLVRFTLRWNDVSRRPPKNPTSPRDPAYNWNRPDRVLRGLRRTA